MRMKRFLILLALQVFFMPTAGAQWSLHKFDQGYEYPSLFICVPEKRYSNQDMEISEASGEVVMHTHLQHRGNGKYRQSAWWRLHTLDEGPVSANESVFNSYTFEPKDNTRRIVLATADPGASELGV